MKSPQARSGHPVAPALRLASCIGSEHSHRDFNTLSQALLTFRRDKQRAPRDWQDATGYLKQMPTAPPGKSYTFDRSLNVQMVPAQ